MQRFVSHIEITVIARNVFTKAKCKRAINKKSSPNEKKPASINQLNTKFALKAVITRYLYGVL